MPNSSDHTTRLAGSGVNVGGCPTTCEGTKSWGCAVSPLTPTSSISPSVTPLGLSVMKVLKAADQSKTASTTCRRAN